MNKNFNREIRETREQRKKMENGHSFSSIPFSRISRGSSTLRSNATEDGRLTPLHNRLAFTLLELLLVVSIIGLLATVALPHLAGFGKSNAMTSATRQLLDDVALARQKAMSTRSKVYMVFLAEVPSSLTGQAAIQSSNLLASQYSSYALYADRSVGDQPGQHTKRYLSDWKTLPQGVFIPTEKFSTTMTVVDPKQPDWNVTLKILRFDTNSFVFPSMDRGVDTAMAYIAFTSQGALASGQDEYIPLTRGSVMMMPPTETPRGNSTNNYNIIHIDCMTGRAKLERQEIH